MESFTNREKTDIRLGVFHAQSLLCEGMTVTPEAKKSNPPDRAASRGNLSSLYRPESVLLAEIELPISVASHVDSMKVCYWGTFEREYRAMLYSSLACGKTALKS
jgi:hypothetical protein